MIIRKYTSREISFGFWAGRRVTEDRSLPKLNFNRTFKPLNPAIGKKANREEYFQFSNEHLAVLRFSITQVYFTIFKNINETIL